MQLVASLAVSGPSGGRGTAAGLCGCGTAWPECSGLHARLRDARDSKSTKAVESHGVGAEANWCCGYGLHGHVRLRWEFRRQPFRIAPSVSGFRSGLRQPRHTVFGSAAALAFRRAPANLRHRGLVVPITSASELYSPLYATLRQVNGTLRRTSLYVA